MIPASLASLGFRERGIFYVGANGHTPSHLLFPTAACRKLPETSAMLSPEMNERLTRVGSGTPCGELMRRYWIPIAPFTQLIENPVRKVRVLGESLVLFRNTQCGLGLIGDRCLHRLVDLQFGNPDDCGLRCPYHGWLFSETGDCIERPMEARPHQKMTRKLAGYPVQEMGGLVFAYLGPLPAPALPRWDLFVWPNAVRQIAINVLDCNWLQCQENTGDPTHSVWAHGHFFRYALERQGKLDERAGDHRGFCVVAEAEAVARAGGEREDVFQRAAEFDA